MWHAYLQPHSRFRCAGYALRQRHSCAHDGLPRLPKHAWNGGLSCVGLKSHLAINGWVVSNAWNLFETGDTDSLM